MSRWVAVLPFGRNAISASDDNTLKLWNLETGECLRTFKGHTREVKSLAMLPRFRWVISGSEDRTMKLWSVDGAICLATWQAEGDVVCCAGDSEVFLVGTRDGEVLFLKLMPPGHVKR